MARIIDDVSRTFSEYLLLPGLTGRNNIPSKVSLKTPLAGHSESDEAQAFLNNPFVSASMQAVSGVEMAISLARQGSLAFIYCSQTIDRQAAMIERVKSHKAGFVQSDSNLKPDNSLTDAVMLSRKSGHSTMPVTHNGTKNGKFLGIITDKDYWEFEDDLGAQVSEYMTPKEAVIYGKSGISLHEANSLLHKHKKECLPVLDNNGCLQSLVFKKDYIDHRRNPYELLDSQKRLVVMSIYSCTNYKSFL